MPSPPGAINVGAIQAAVGVDWKQVTAGIAAAKKEIAGAFQQTEKTADGAAKSVEKLSGDWTKVASKIKSKPLIDKDLLGYNAIEETSAEVKKLAATWSSAMAKMKQSTRGMGGATGGYLRETLNIGSRGMRGYGGLGTLGGAVPEGGGGGALASIAGETKTAAVSATTQAFSSLGSTILTVAAAYATLRGAQEAIDLARQNTMLEDSKRIFEASGQSLQDFRKATKGMISDAELIQKFGLAQQMGLSAKEFKQLAVVADAAAKKTGQSQDYMFQSIMVGTARSSRMILDNLGIIVDWDAAHQKMAKSLHKTVAQLTQQEQKQSEINAVMEQGKDLVASVAGVNATASDIFDQWDASTKNITTTMGTLFLPAIRAVIPVIKELADWVQKTFGTYTPLSPGQRSKDAAAELGAMASDLERQIKVHEFNAANKITFNGREQTAADALKIVEKLQNRAREILSIGEKQQDVLDNQKRKVEEQADAAAKLKEIADARLRIERELEKMQEKHAQAQVNPTTAKLMEIGSTATHGFNEAMAPYKGSKQEGDAAMRAFKAFTDQETDQVASMLEGTKTLEEFNDIVAQAAKVLGDDIANNAQLNPNVVPHLEGLKREALTADMSDVVTKPSFEQDTDKLIKSVRDGLDMSQAPALGSMLGNASMMGDAIAGPLAGVIQQSISDLGETLKGAMSALFNDSRLASALGTGAQSASAGLGAALVGVSAGAASPFAALAALVAALVLPLTVIVGVIVALNVALLALLVAVVGMPLVMGGVFGAFASLATQTKSYERMQGALSMVMDRVIASLEPFFANALALVGLFDSFANVFGAFIEEIVNSDVLWRLLFTSMKYTGIAVASLATVSAAVYDAFVQVAGAAAFMVEFVTSLGDADKATDAYQAVVDSFSVQLADLGSTIQSLIDLNYDDAKSKGELLAKQWDLKQATDSLTSSVLNAPQGFRVEQYRYNSQNPSPNGAGGGGNGGSGGNGNGPVIHVHGDLVIMPANGDLNDAMNQLQDAADRAAAQNTGNPTSGGGRRLPWR